MSRIDFRSNEQIRPLACCLGEISEANGSCTFSQGHTEVSATVYGPTQPKYSRHEHYDAASLEIDFSVSGTARTATSSTGGNNALARLERSAGKFLRQSLLGAVMLKEYPRMIIVIKVCVVRDDGAMLSVALNAAALALMDAGIAMNYLPNSVSIFMPGSPNDSNNMVESSSSSSSSSGCVVDPTSSEEKEAASTYLFTFNPSTIGSTDDRVTSSILHTHATGRNMTTITTMEAMELGKKASKIILDFIRKMNAERLGL